mgnify:FL=1
MSNNLCQWCLDKYDEETCNNNEICDKKKEYDLLDFINKNLPSDKKLQKEIAYKRKTIQNLEALEFNNNYLANKRNYYNFIKIETQTKRELIYLIILLVIAICLGIYCIYYYFLIK